MIARIYYLTKYYLHLLVIFALQKPLFMLFTKGEESYRFADWLRVVYHGFVQDLSTAAYITAIPLLVAIVSLWWRGNFNPRKVLQPYHIIVSLLLATIFVADISLYPFWQYKLDASALLYLSTPQEAAASVSIWYIVIRILAIIAIAKLYHIALNRVTPKRFDHNQNYNHSGTPINRVLSTIALLIAGALLFLAIRGGTKESTMNVGRVYFSNDQYLNHSAVNPAFSLFSSVGKSKDYKKLHRYIEDEKAETIASEFFAGSKDLSITDTLLKTTHPNILIIEMESFGSAFTSPTAEGYSAEDVVPEYLKIESESICFTNFYCNSYRTDRGTVTIFSAFPAFPELSIMKQPKIVAALPGLTEQFAKRGYSTHFLYGGDINFTNTKGYLLTNGFTNITADIDFTKEQQRTNKWGVDDAITFNHLQQELLQLSNNPDSLFFYAFLTLSSHEPFDVPEKLLQNKVYNAAAHTDKQLGKLISSLKKSNLWDNLLIVIMPDHNMLYNTKNYSKEYFRCKMLWSGGAIKESGKRIETIMNQSDFGATLLAQLGMDNSLFPFSRNIFSPSYTTPTAFSCYKGGFMVADTLGSTSYDLEQNSVVEATHRALQNGEAAQAQEAANSLRVLKGKALLQTLSHKLSEYEEGQHKIAE